MEELRPNYLKVRRWVDSRLSRDFQFGPKQAFAPAILPLLPLVLFRSTVLPIWILALTISAIWCAFVGWRASRMIQAGNIKGARDYDRRGKFDLPPEYASSESLMAHQRRKRSFRQ